MSVRAGAAAVAGAPAAPRPGRAELRIVPAHEHDWRLRDTEDVDGLRTRRFECDACGGVDFTY